jgi:hypothetical protein
MSAACLLNRCTGCARSAGTRRAKAQEREEEDRRVEKEKENGACTRMKKLRKHRQISLSFNLLVER